MKNELWPVTEKRKETALADTPIPEIPSVMGWKEVPIIENKEGLVPIGPFTSYWDIFTDSVYFGERVSSPYEQYQLKGALITQFVREEVADRLRIAQVSLPPNMLLVVFDSFRRIEVQQSLFDTYFKSLKEKNPQSSHKELMAEAQRFVSVPSKDPKKPSPHNTGGAVDVVIIELPPVVSYQVAQLSKQLNFWSYDWQKQYEIEMRRIGLIAQAGRLLNFGTPFDSSGESATLRFLEELKEDRELVCEEKEAQENRRILYHVMRVAGFEGYPDEWWHFNSPKSQMGARTAGLPFAQYGSAEGFEDLAHERMRIMHRNGSLMILSDTHPGPPKGLEEHFRLASQVVNEIGDLRNTNVAKAEIMLAQE